MRQWGAIVTHNLPLEDVLRDLNRWGRVPLDGVRVRLFARLRDDDLDWPVATWKIAERLDERKKKLEATCSTLTWWCYSTAAVVWCGWKMTSVTLWHNQSTSSQCGITPEYYAHHYLSAHLYWHLSLFHWCWSDLDKNILVWWDFRMGATVQGLTLHKSFFNLNQRVRMTMRSRICSWINVSHLGNSARVHTSFLQSHCHSNNSDIGCHGWLCPMTLQFDRRPLSGVPDTDLLLETTMACLQLFN